MKRHKIGTPALYIEFGPPRKIRGRNKGWPIPPDLFVGGRRVKASHTQVLLLACLFEELDGLSHTSGFAPSSRGTAYTHT
jgi:hypothetical protein